MKGMTFIEKKLCNSIVIPIAKLHPFEGHPYKVLDNEEMEMLTESVQNEGVLSPLIVRPLEDTNEYEVISGHRRLHAAQRAGLSKVPALVHEISREEAAIVLVDSNLHREHILPSEKAFAYKLKMEALKHRGITCGQVGHKSRDSVSQTDSGRTVQRFIRLTYLTPELQEYVDKGKMKVSPAVEISFLDEELQRDIVDRIDETEIFPSHAQARRMKQLAGEGKLDYESIKEIMSELKPNQVEKLKIPMDSIRQYAPRGATPKDMENLLIRLARENYERQCRMRDDDAR